MSKKAFSEFLRCKICLDTYDEPKNLICGHTYCKNCLDNILVFKEDGSAEINCPLKCKLSVTTDKDDTTSSLPTNYALCGFIGDMQEKTDLSSEHQQCQKTKQCNMNIKWLCRTCGAKNCDKCEILHTRHHKSFTAVTFNKKLQEFQPMCKQHMSIANQVCTDCDCVFICVYCAHREHNNHRKESIVEFGKETKAGFASLIDAFKDTKILMESLTKRYNEALINFKSDREKLVRELELRKLKRMEQFLELLDSEDKNIVRKFDEKVKEFQKNAIGAGYTDYTKGERVSEYINTVNSKTLFELVAEKEEVERQLRDLTSLPTTVPGFNLHLAVLKDQDFYNNPMGEIIVEVNDLSTASIDSGAKAIYKSHITKTERKCNQLELKRKLMVLAGSIKENERTTSGTGAEKKTKSDAVQKNKALHKGAYTFADVDEIIKNGDVEMLQQILITDPFIVKMRDSFRATLLMRAASYNKPSVAKALIDAGSDVNASRYDLWTPFHISAFHGHQDALKVLINHDVTCINTVNHRRKTPLHYACDNGHVGCVQLLLSIPGIDVNVKTMDNDTPLHVASRNGSYQCVRLLLSTPHTDLNARRSSSETPLHFASSYGNIECVKLLLSKPNIDVNIRSIVNKTAYHVGSTDGIKQLLEKHKSK
ncbi:ankyrin-1-like [Hydractinia symbiolongicarpus]|uniref:ankyrin-1-like n=1 Tax=Hydractinia symbiolongicarpus TaxID=13093 RepID=UPI002549C42B|nr:ankyrin-1-like [Hydractinia symbiolongicarpus]